MSTTTSRISYIYTKITKQQKSTKPISTEPITFYGIKVTAIILYEKLQVTVLSLRIITKQVGNTYVQTF